MFFLHLWQDKPLWVNLKTVIFLETANTQKSEVFLLRMSLGNVNESFVTCLYRQIYNFSFRKEFLETLCECNSLF